VIQLPQYLIIIISFVYSTLMANKLWYEIEQIFITVMDIFVLLAFE